MEGFGRCDLSGLTSAEDEFVLLQGNASAICLIARAVWNLVTTQN